MIAILTDFINYDPAYSLCRIVRDQCKMLQRAGCRFRMIAREGYHGKPGDYPGAEIVTANPGKTGDNQVHLTPEVPQELETLTADLERALEGVTVVLAHDLIYQPNCWKWHIAARRIAGERPGIKWIQWVHSSTDLGISRQVGPYVGELQGPFPNSLLVAFHREEVNRKGAAIRLRAGQNRHHPQPGRLFGGRAPVDAAHRGRVRADARRRDRGVPVPAGPGQATARRRGDL